MWPFRQSQTPRERHGTVLELIEDVQKLKGQIKSLEAEWDDIRAQIRKGYQRLEKAAERAKAPCPDENGADPIPDSVPTAARGFAEKYRALKGA